MAAANSIPFSKYHGLGNDFVVIDAVAQPRLADVAWERLAARVCHRHTGIGADGVLVLSRADTPDVAMRIVNADGSDGGMCGNGVRCIARHMVERHGHDGQAVRVRVGSRLVVVRCEMKGGVFAAACVDLGPPSQREGAGGWAEATTFTAEPIQPSLLTACDAASPGWRDHCGLDAAMVQVGIPNPHAVMFCHDVARVPLREVGPVIERHEAFPGRTNVQFVQVLGDDRVRVRTWERGAGATLACGTGACAVAVAGAAMGRVKREVVVELPGGELRIRWDAATNHVFMTGPADRVFDGEIRVDGV